MLGEQRATPENLARMVQELMTNSAERRRLAGALAITTRASRRCYASTGNPASFQPRKPPSMEMTLV